MDTTIYTFLATGFEEIEAFAVIDICRRAGINVKTVSIVGEPEVVSVHGIKVIADTVFEECDFSDASMLFLPIKLISGDTLSLCNTLVLLAILCCTYGVWDSRNS